uniref:HTH OST-type domain-containing protein n=1 Tax=Romanomermis culicivorax TaxID=13658 RepID=A0A915JBK5_ROMCU
MKFLLPAINHGFFPVPLTQMGKADPPAGRNSYKSDNAEYRKINNNLKRNNSDFLQARQWTFVTVGIILFPAPSVGKIFRPMKGMDEKVPFPANWQAKIFPADLIVVVLLNIPQIKKNMQAQWNHSRIEDLGITLRSILTSFKGGCPPNKLQQEYAETCGSKIPFQSLGFPTLIECLERCLGAYVRIIRRDNEVICMAVDTNEISHISALVKGQKSSKKTKKTAAPFRNRSRSYSSFSNSRGRPELTYQSRRGSSSANRAGSGGFNGSFGRQFNNHVFSRRPSAQDFLKDTNNCSSSSSSIGLKFKTSNAESNHRISTAFSSNQNSSSYTINGPKSTLSFSTNVKEKVGPGQIEVKKFYRQAIKSSDFSTDTRMSIKEELAEAAKKCGFHEPVYRTITDGKNRYLCAVT